MPSPRHAPVHFTAPAFEVLEAERQRFRTATELACRTIDSYERDMRVFRAWCAVAGRSPLPASSDTVQLYITDLIHHGRKVATLSRHLSGIRHTHRLLGHENPCNDQARAILAGAKRLLCEQPSQKTALTLSQLRAIAGTIGGETAIRARNAALLLLGFSTALRRSNLAMLCYEDITIGPDSITAFIRHEKQDRTGNGRTVSIPAASDAIICAVRAIKRWIEWRGKRPGALFQGVYCGRPSGKPISGNRIAQIVQDAASGIGLDPRSYAGHSLRSGFITEAILAGISDHEIMNHTGHRSLEMLRTYFRPVYALRESPCRKIGL